MVRKAMALLVVLCGALVGAAQAQGQAMDSTPRLGLLVPVGPPDYAVILDAFKQTAEVKGGPFTYRAGTIAGVPVVVSIASASGPLARSLAAAEMLHHFNIKAFVYGGTSGGHLEPGEMRIGDIVLGAKNVDFMNFFMGKDGRIEASEFAAVQPDIKRYEDLYADPVLLSYLACSATRVAAKTELPGWINPKFPRTNPDIFYYGIQGTATVWLANKEFIEKTMAVFHEIDEDGDWYSNLVATMYGIPFIEVSVIANSIYEFPDTARGLPPAPPAGEKARANVIAQRVSNRVVVDLVEHFGAQMLKGKYITPTTDPYSAEFYKTPKNPQKLLSGLECK
jgi:adenosylhomocysteine nucleosidase